MTRLPLPGRPLALPDPPPFTPRPRFALKPVGPPSGLLDGAWWPHSDDLAHELPLLIAELDHGWGRITRVTVDPRHWRQPLPARLRIAGHVIRIGWCAVEQDPHKLLLLSFGVRRCDLLVVPPQTDPTTAARLMAAATDPATRQTASALLAAAVALATNAWESDSGVARASLTPGQALPARHSAADGTVEHLKARFEQQGTFGEAELWAAQLSRAAEARGGSLGLEALAEETGLTYEQIGAGTLWQLLCWKGSSP
ncbi:DUF5994 family protein [Streptacidiphilus neutrinimicus]|uniref:DUF5994 family protein n=1 Tax=Streptacidiphilus neutrinimicus TaxID=105420 RepID=UPI001F1F8FF3|nr:DUF5994 family protein [Streptacidiphilus neutrinimicus]